MITFDQLIEGFFKDLDVQIRDIIDNNELSYADMKAKVIKDIGQEKIKSISGFDNFFDELWNEKYPENKPSNRESRAIGNSRFGREFSRRITGRM